MKIFFFDRFAKNAQISIFMKIRPVGAELFHAEGQTDMTEPIVAFRYFARAPNNAAYPPPPRSVTHIHLRQYISWGYYLIISHIGHVFFLLSNARG
jgi:hypothetical protein